MNRTTVVFSIVTLLFLNSASVRCSLPHVSQYSLTFHLSPQEQQLAATASITVINTSDLPVDELHVLLYRLLNITEVSRDNGEPIGYTQNIVAFSDEPALQANSIQIALPSPLTSGDSITLNVNYKGFLFGYTEVMGYVHDRIDDEYSLLRPDAIAYPILAEPSFESYIASFRQPFNYRCDVTVPKGIIVACGGTLTRTIPLGDSVTYIYTSKIPVTRIDIAAARFITLSNPEQHLTTYALREDSLGAINVLKGMSDCVSLYAVLFGQPEYNNGYTAIEIPEGWGSQAGAFYFLQTAAAFRDPTSLHEVYHEIAHTWNIHPASSIQRCRYFDEAFASYFEKLAVKAFQGDSAYVAALERSRNLFLNKAAQQQLYFDSPIADYGKHEIGQLSYTKGAWSLYVFHQLLGDTKFYALMKELFHTYAGRSISFEEFKQFSETTSGLDLTVFFNEWIFGAESSLLLKQGMSIEQIVQRYR